MKKFLSVNDIEICIDDTEEGENALLLIHGLTGDKTTMYPIRDMFKDDFLRDDLLAMDLFFLIGK